MAYLPRQFLSRRAVGPFLLVLVSAGLSAPASFPAETVAGLASRLDEAIRQVEAARDAGGPLGDPGSLFPEAEDVVWRNEAMRVDHTSLRAEWRAVPGEGEPRRQALDRLRHRLAAVRAELGSGPASGSGAGGRPQAASPSASEQDATGARGDAAETPPAPGWREKLSEILSRPEFGKREAQESLLSRLIRWLRDKLAFLFPGGTGRALGAITRWVVYTLAGAAALLVLLVLVRAAMPLFRPEVRAPGYGSAPARPETPETLLGLAEARARAGDFRRAVQAIFRWMLLALHQAGRLDYDPALTNREHLPRLKADLPVRAAFEELSRQYELAWYALQPVNPLEYATFKAACQHLAGGHA